MGLIEQVISEDQELVGNGNWLHGSENDSLVVDVEHQRFFWNSKDIRGDVYTYLMKVRGLTFPEAKKYVAKFSNSEFIGSPRGITLNSDTVVYPALVDAFYEEGKNNPRDYWYDRGINDSTIDRFKLGFHDGWYTIPFFQEGVFQNFQLRHDIPEKEILPYYRGLGRILFNPDILKITNEILIIEGPTSCLRLLQEGVPCVSHNAGAEGWDDNWFTYFIKQKMNYVVYDNDDAGKKGALKVAQSLGLYRCKLYNFNEFEKKGYDVVDFFRDGYDVGTLLKLVREKSKYAFELEEKEL